MTIEDRLAAVEKTNRKLKLSIVLILALFFVLGRRDAMQGTFDELTARKITVFGQFGEVIVGIGSADTIKGINGKSLSNGGAIVVRDGHGIHSAGIMADRETAGVVVSSINPNKMVTLTSENDKGFPELSITAPDASAHLTVAGKTSALQIVAGRARVSAGVLSNVPMVAVVNGDDYDALTVGQQP